MTNIDLTTKEGRDQIRRLASTTWVTSEDGYGTILAALSLLDEKDQPAAWLDAPTGPGWWKLRNWTDPRFLRRVPEVVVEVYSQGETLWFKLTHEGDVPGRWPISSFSGSKWQLVLPWPYAPPEPPGVG